MSKHVLFLLDGYDVANSGVYGLHRYLMRTLSREDDTKVSCLVVRPLAEDVDDAEKWTITLLSPTNDTDDDDDDDTDGSDDEHDDCNKPLEYIKNFKHYYPELPKQTSDVTHLVAYAPHTAAVANDIRQWLGLRDIKLVLVIYNLLEAETGGLGSPDWPGAGIDCSADDVVSCARSADFVFSVGKDVFCHWDRELRVNDVAGVDHRRLMPAWDEFGNIELLSPSPDHTHPRIVTLMMDTSDDSARFMETAADAIGRAARSKNIDVTWEVQLPKLENSEKRRLISQWKGLAKTPLMKLVSTECRCREDVVKSLRKATMCIQAGEFLRCGYSGMEAIMAGVPTLVPKLSAVGRLIEELFNIDARHFLLNKRYEGKDDAIEEWANQIRTFIDHQDNTQKNALQMKQNILDNDDIKDKNRCFIDVFKGKHLFSRARYCKTVRHIIKNIVKTSRNGQENKRKDSIA